MKILIADDDKMSRQLLIKTLEREGYTVIAVDNGRLFGENAEPLCVTSARNSTKRSSATEASLQRYQTR